MQNRRRSNQNNNGTVEQKLSELAAWMQKESTTGYKRKEVLIIMLDQNPEDSGDQQIYFNSLNEDRRDQVYMMSLVEHDLMNLALNGEDEEG